MYKLTKEQANKVDSLTFSELNMTENELEEILRKNIDMICDEEESMLIVGKQVRNAELGRSDLTAIDNNGNVVLIEIKRDINDIKTRKEAFEFQAIRYAASYATIVDVDDLVNKIYAPYLEKYRNEFQDESANLTSTELATRKVHEFLELNEATNNFNKQQRIILVASDFDSQTLSAVAWLNKNTVDISCYKLIPYKIQDDIFVKVDKVLPTEGYDDFYVDLLHTGGVKPKKLKTSRRSLPRIKDMLQWGVVKVGDVIQAKGEDEQGTLLENGNIFVDGQEKTLASWLKEIYGWESVQTYRFSIHEKTGKSLAEIRNDYMKEELE